MSSARPGAWAPRCARRCSTIPQLELVAAVDPLHAGIDLRQFGIDAPSMQISRSADALADAGAEVAVDFTVVDAARDNLTWCAEHGVHAVVGTTGFGADDIDAVPRRVRRRRAPTR